MAGLDNMTEAERKQWQRERLIEHTIDCVINDYMEGDSDDGKNLHIYSRYIYYTTR